MRGTDSFKLLLGVIVGLAFFLRMYRVTSIPPSLSWDEVSIGYNAYSILKTGRDEHDRFLPLDAFVAYGDYKPSLPIYITVPFVAFFGLNELAVRLPSVFAGTLTIFFTYILVLELFRHQSANLQKFALLSAILLAISPWHIQLSRAGFEANIALLFIVLGIVLVLKTRIQKHLFYFCWIPFVAAFYTFNSARFVVPILSFILLVYLYKSFMNEKKRAIVGMIISVILLLPIIPHLFSKEARLRFTEVNIFSDASIVRVANDRIAADGNTWWSNIIHNRRIGYARSYLIHFFDHFEPRFLFIRGDGNPKFSLQDVGELYTMEFPFVILGIIFLFRNSRSLAWLLLGWLVASIIPAATARETPHALRIENGLPVFIIMAAYGIYAVVLRMNVRVKKIAVAGILFFYIGNVSYFWHTYIHHYPTEYSGEWQYGYKEALRVISPIQSKYDQIVLTENIGRPYMYVLFYAKIDPAIFQKSVKGYFDAAGFYHVTAFGQYAFATSPKGFRQNVLYVMLPSQIPPKARVLYTIQLLNGSPILSIFDI